MSGCVIMVKKYVGRYLIMLIIGILLIMVIKVFGMDYDLNNLFTIRTLDSLYNSIQKEQTIIEDCKNKIIECEELVNKTNAIKNNNISESNRIIQQIDELKIICGNTDVSGQGITLRIADNVTDETLSYNDKIVHDLDVRLIVNDLNNLGAEAIAINGKRIVNTTEIICSGPVISINGEVVAAPFFIKAIGDPEKLIEAVTSESSYAYFIKKDYGIDITAMKNYIVVISGKAKNRKISHAMCIDEEN